MRQHFGGFAKAIAGGLAVRHARGRGLVGRTRGRVAPLGIKVTFVEPGPFRTDWAGRSLHQTESRIADYAETTGARLKATAKGSGSQPGDPARAAEAMIRVTESENPPRHLVLGAFGTGDKQAQGDLGRDRGLARDGPRHRLPEELTAMAMLPAEARSQRPSLRAGRHHPAQAKAIRMV